MRLNLRLPQMIPCVHRRNMGAFAARFVVFIAVPHSALAVPSFARQTGFPCAQCHVYAFGPALTPVGRQFKLNGYTLRGDDAHPMPLALMLQGGFSETAASQPAAPAPHFSTNDNISLDQASIFVGTRITDQIGMLAQGTYSGEQRHFAWDNTDIRWAKPLKLFGGAVVGISVNNNPTVQDLWNSTPAWGFPYINSPLVPTPGASPVISGALAQLVLGGTAYAMIRDHVYLEGGLYRGLSDRGLDAVGLYPASSPHVEGGAPYWRAAYQRTGDSGYWSVGTFGLDVKMRPDPTLPAADRFTDMGFDAVYQYSGGGPNAILVNTSYIRERQDLTASFAASESSGPSNYLDAWSLDASYIYRQTWSAGIGLFNLRGGRDLTLYAPASLTGSNDGLPDSRGYTLQVEWVPFGKKDSWLSPWVNARLGVQYTGYLRFNGGTSNYDGFGRSNSQNNSLFLFAWLAY